ncbi:MAG: PIG-L family deacetylase, partial [Pseudomonadota bacterium]
MSEDRRRLEAAAADNAMTRLWDALQSLRTSHRFLQTGAHPDDETSALLTTLARRDGVKVAFACAVRGEGGQNAIGTERGTALGVLRTREMELAARRIPMRIYWLNEALDGPIHDFGLAKSAEETLAIWGHERTLERLVHVIRHFRPDVMMPTFLDVEGQHGHHRAVTRLTEEAFDAAADPTAFKDQGLAPWQVKKLYLPAWSGAGAAYDDTEPPPPATIDIDVGRRDPATGLTFDQLGQWSRAAHVCQGMGRWLDPAPRALSLHRKGSTLNIDLEEDDLFDGLPRRLSDWSDDVFDQKIADDLRDADHAIDQCLDAFPDEAKVLKHATGALAAIRGLLGDVDAVPDRATSDLRDRLATKYQDLSKAALLASGVTVDVAPVTSEIAEGEAVEVIARLWHGGTVGLEAFAARWVFDSPTIIEKKKEIKSTRLDPGAVDEVSILAKPKAGAPRVHPYAFFTDSDEPAAPVSLELSWGRAEERVEVTISPKPSIARLPSTVATPMPDRFVVNTTLSPSSINIAVELERRGSNSDQPCDWHVPEGWSITPNRLVPSKDVGDATERLEAILEVPSTIDEGRYRIELHNENGVVQSLNRIKYAHIEETHFLRPATIDVLATSIALPRGVRVGYIGAGTDRTAAWLRAIGLDVTDLDVEALGEGLEGIDSLVIGVMAFGKRPELREATAMINAWVKAGGHLVTQYHRPWDGWDPDETPPCQMEIGQPSLRWRVTNPDAEVIVMRPDHPLLTAPNIIDATDWHGWVKERGLYFAKSWDAAY